MRGELKIRNFTLWGAPLVARIISLASFSGLGNALSGQGVPVDRLVAPFRIQDQVHHPRQARLVGSDIGARADGDDRSRCTSASTSSGTVAPAYTVNRIFGRIPIVGQILSGSRSDAALAATFSVSRPDRAAAGQRQPAGRPGARHDPRPVRRAHRRLAGDGGRLDDR